MDIKAALMREIQETYDATRGLLKFVDDDQLDWKPSNENNWWTTGQLIEHIRTACGWCVHGFVTGEWDMSEWEDMEMPEDGSMPKADAYPSAVSVSEIERQLDEDQKKAISALEAVNNNEWENPITAPWQIEKPLFGQILDSIKHLKQHQTQLFYYLKLQGKPMNTALLWGMEEKPH